MRTSPLEWQAQAQAQAAACSHPGDELPPSADVSREDGQVLGRWHALGEARAR